MSMRPAEYFDLTGRKALVTGGGRGLGAASAEALAAAGAAVAVLDLDGGSARLVAERIIALGGRAIELACDVTDEAAAVAAFDRAVAALDGIDILVNSAGRAIRRPATEVSLEDWSRVMDLNVKALFSCSRIAARHMKAAGRGGAIVQLGSVMGVSGGVFPNASYQASKGAVLNLTRALALEWAPDNIRVNAVAPYFVKTPFTAAVFADETMRNAVMAHAPLGRLPEPEDVAAAVLYLASPAARCVTGSILTVDSGYMAR